MGRTLQRTKVMRCTCESHGSVQDVRRALGVIIGGRHTRDAVRGSFQVGFTRQFIGHDPKGDARHCVEKFEVEGVINRNALTVDKVNGVEVNEAFAA